jgi:uncharacterized protein (TIGR03067 family)
MRLHSLLLVTVGVLVAAEEKDDAVKKDKAKLKGSWEVVAIEEDGKPAQPLPKDRKMKVVFQDDKIVVTDYVGDKVTDSKEAAYSIDPTKKPAQLDIVPADGPGKGKVVPHIYTVDKDELKLCGATEESPQRPKEFATKEGSKSILLVLKREKK